MNERPIKTIQLPETSISVDIRTWINGREAEYIEEPIFKAATLSGKSSDGSMDIGINAETAIHEQNHRIVESRVAKIKVGETEILEKQKILEYILNDIPASDYDFILSEIQKIAIDSKKK